MRYSGGDTPNASYRDHRDHAEAVEIIFDPKVISFREILGVLLPNTRSNHARPEDRGRSYRSAIFYTSEAQKQVTLDTSADVKASGLWPGKVVTGIGPAGGFWEEEPEHQDYPERHPNGYTCHFPRLDWKLPQRAEAQKAN